MEAQAISLYNNATVFQHLYNENYFANLGLLQIISWFTIPININNNNNSYNNYTTKSNNKISKKPTTVYAY